MIKFEVIGLENLKKGLLRFSQINKIAYDWMKSGQPDEIMNKSFQKNFTSQGRPNKWKALSPITKEERKKLGFGTAPILRRTGNLYDEITSMIGKKAISSRESSVEWGINQLRKEEQGKFAGHQLGKRTPKRQTLGFQKEDKTRLVRSLREWIFKQVI
jgi:phage gpG-like protein